MQNFEPFSAVWFLVLRVQFRSIQETGDESHIMNSLVPTQFFLLSIFMRQEKFLPLSPWHIHDSEHEWNPRFIKPRVPSPASTTRFSVSEMKATLHHVFDGALCPLMAVLSTASTVLSAPSVPFPVSLPSSNSGTLWLSVLLRLELSWSFFVWEGFGNLRVA